MATGILFDKERDYVKGVIRYGALPVDSLPESSNAVLIKENQSNIPDKTFIWGGLLSGYTIDSTGSLELISLYMIDTLKKFGYTPLPATRDRKPVISDLDDTMRWFGIDSEIRDGLFFIRESRVYPSSPQEKCSPIGVYNVCEGTIPGDMYSFDDADIIFTPSKFCRDIYIENGVDVDVIVWNHGIDPAVFKYVPRNSDGVFTFTFVGGGYGSDLRKNQRNMIRAFIAADLPKNDVQFIYKAPGGDVIQAVRKEFNQENIKYIDVPYSRFQIRDLYNTTDCIVLVSRAEGFGMPPLEAMATGCCAMVTNYSGMKDYADPDDTYLVNVKKMVPVEWIVDSGVWAEPDFDHMVEMYRYAYYNRDETIERGKRAAKRVHAHWKWTDTTEKVLPYIDRYIGISKTRLRGVIEQKND